MIILLMVVKEIHQQSNNNNDHKECTDYRQQHAKCAAEAAENKEEINMNRSAGEYVKYLFNV